MQCLPLPPASFETTLNDLWNLHGVGLAAAELAPHVYAFFHQPQEESLVDWLVTVNSLTHERLCLLLDPKESLKAGADGDATWAVIQLCEETLPMELFVSTARWNPFERKQDQKDAGAPDVEAAWLN